MKYLTVTETAKLLRCALKESFPDVKFSVVSSKYAGGASITINYCDGPTFDQVDRVASLFIDGIQDLKTYKTSLLDGEPVHFGADYIFINRRYTPDVIGLVVNDKIINLSMCGDIVVELSVWGGVDKVSIKPDSYAGLKERGFDESAIKCFLNREIRQTSFCETKPSKTVARVSKTMKVV